MENPSLGRRLIGFCVAGTLIFGARELLISVLGSGWQQGQFLRGHVGSAVVALSLAALISVLFRYNKRQSIHKAGGDGVGVGLIGNILFDYAQPLGSQNLVLLLVSVLSCVLASFIVFAFSRQASARPVLT